MPKERKKERKQQDSKHRRWDKNHNNPRNKALTPGKQGRRNATRTTVYPLERRNIGGLWTLIGLDSRLVLRTLGAFQHESTQQTSINHYRDSDLI
mmetsp:Transcript_3533/g.9938  ORF Transcript_3533/g.9938 Transcript_3533/m.9938 type:complete len:95 (+) Transcript_3533:996-1280(+)